ncbi:hypothetical protein N7455_001775 [Penicillium solitum]|uniref:Genomic scaffold, ProqFM164S01 n=1 Tax=Penicillium roqueforti (strain FM164) TaxID=1365484 RepID=W6PRA7_PENRF|nr:hypothetical protein N7536_005734 [Penicillium majusculum]KAJ5878310.1 hypothetical protein N7455_001775 [Penicillium solitum]CDM26256.1 unnamed protein product [Penicillium roqueforti FM164]
MNKARQQPHRPDSQVTSGGILHVREIDGGMALDGLQDMKDDRFKNIVNIVEEDPIISLRGTCTYIV